MKKLKSSLGAKTAAVFLLVIFLALLALSVVGAFILGEEEVYLDGGAQLKTDMLNSVAWDTVSDCETLAHSFGTDAWAEFLANYEERYQPEKSNFYVSVSVDGQTKFENRSPRDYLVNTKQTSEIHFTKETSRSTVSSFNSTREYEAYLRRMGDKVLSTTVLDSTDGKIRARVELEESVDHVALIQAAVMKNMTAVDRASRAGELADLLAGLSRWVIPIGVLSLLCAGALLVFLICAAGHKAGVEGIHLNWIDRIPFDLYVAVLLVGFFVTASIVDYGLWDFGQIVGVMILVGLGVIWAMLWLSTILSFATRAKAGKWWRNTLTFYILRFFWRTAKWLGRGLKSLCRNLPLYWKFLVIFLGLTFLEFLFLIGDAYFLFWVAEKLLLLPLLILLVINFRRLETCGQEIAAGNMEARVSLAHMLPEMRRHGESLNSIGLGMQRAVEVQMRSERMKAELITNVSHDIKTPLTSIVSYVDLLKKEGLSSPRAPEYLEVLDRQSARLKKLTTDLVEASKAATGNTPVQLERTDVHVLLSQAVGEYEEKLREKHLTPVLNLGAKEPYISADGRLLWRVLDNLLSNVCKYAQEQTRVYLQTAEKDGLLELTCKNVSREELNIPPAELMERFVRGDASRNTEGSGLGLSIARSLTELQGGRFDIAIDGDLFKVTLQMPLCP